MHDENYTYTEEEGLQFAVGYMVKVDPEAYVSPSDLFNIEMWGARETYSLHNCTADEMKKLQDGSGKFFPLEPAMKRFVKQDMDDWNWATVWLCADQTNLTIRGNF